MKLKLIIIGFVITFITSNNLFAAEITPYQKKVLKICEKYGNLIGYPETLMAIAFNESTAGMAYPVNDLFLKPFDRSYGIMNVRFATAKFLIKMGYIDFDQPDEYLLIKLIQDPEFNIAVAASYLKYLFNYFQNDEMVWTKAVIGFNTGPGNANKFLEQNKISYLENVKKHINYIRTLKENGEL